MAMRSADDPELTMSPNRFDSLAATRSSRAAPATSTRSMPRTTVT